jgi:hypothetical protein
VDWQSRRPLTACAALIANEKPRPTGFVTGAKSLGVGEQHLETPNTLPANCGSRMNDADRPLLSNGTGRNRHRRKEKAPAASHGLGPSWVMREQPR